MSPLRSSLAAHILLALATLHLLLPASVLSFTSSNALPGLLSLTRHSRFLQPSLRSSLRAAAAAAAAKHPTPYDIDTHPSLSTNIKGDVWLQQRMRPRRNRKSPVIREMVRENYVRPGNLIYPLFIHDEEHNTQIASMPGCVRHSLRSMVEEAGDAMKYGVNTFVLFPKVPENKKTIQGEEAYNPAGIVPRAVALLKAAHPNSIVVTDIALDPYSSVGHDGVVDMQTGEVLNDITVSQLCSQAVCHARAGADIVAPSDMMDGRIGSIRDALDAEGFTNVSILAYTAKYASSFYGPFRDALDSHPGFGDKKAYQQDPANGREALLEAQLDEMEGADMLMVKPGMP